MKKFLGITGAIGVALIAVLAVINIITDTTFRATGENVLYYTDTWGLTMDISSELSTFEDTKDIVLVLEVSDAMDLPPQAGEINVVEPNAATRWQMLKTAATKFIDKVIISQGGTRAAIVAYGGGDALNFPWDNHRILSGFSDDPKALKGVFNYPTSLALRRDIFAGNNGIAGNTNLAAGFYGAGSLLPLSSAREKSIIVIGGTPPDSGYSSQGKALLGEEENSRDAAEGLKKNFENLDIYCFALGDDPLKVFPHCILGEGGYADAIYSASQEIILEEAVDSLCRQYYQGILVVFEPGEGWEPQVREGNSHAMVDVGGNLVWAGDNPRKGSSLSFSLHSDNSPNIFPPCTAITFIPANDKGIAVVKEPEKGKVRVEGNSLVYTPDIMDPNQDQFIIKAEGQEINIEISYEPLEVEG